MTEKFKGKEEKKAKRKISHWGEQLAVKKRKASELETPPRIAEDGEI